MTGICAMAANRAIGLRGGLPWPKLSADLQWFKRTTLGRDVVFGRKTFEHLPTLKGRRIWVLGGGFYNKVDGEQYPYRYVQDIDMLPKDCIVAGGAKVYESLLPYCDEFYLTYMKQDYEGDVYMPPFEHLYADYELVEDGADMEIRRYFR